MYHETGRIPELEPNADFALQLDRAFANPLTRNLKQRSGSSPEDLAHRGEYFSRFADINDSVKIRSFENPGEEWEVSTEDPTLFPLLLAHAMQRLEVTKGIDDPGIVVTTQLEGVVRHETTHGRMARVFGLGSRYGVRVLNDSVENIWAISPFHSLIGDPAGIIMLTRLEEAAIAVAPEDASRADLHTARSLGFINREAVLERLYEVRPDLKPES